MGFLKHLRSKSRLRSKDLSAKPAHPDPPLPFRYGRNQSIRLPESVLAKIFIYVCPHSRDETYEPCEESQIGEGCMLCDLRDLAICAQVCRKWYSIAQTLLYRSIRIDTVHYCELEEILTERRRKLHKGSKSKHGGTKGDVPSIRLSLLARTLRTNTNLANQVTLLKIPYMAREAAKGDLARVISVTHNLQYVDLPDGFYSGESGCLALREELQERCPDIRKMTYRAGAEQSLEWLANRHWQALEILELSGLAMEPVTLRIVLASLPALQNLALSNMSWIDDSIFRVSSGQLPDFPSVSVLKIDNAPHLSTSGLTQYLDVPQNRARLTSLSLHHTGVHISELHKVLWIASALTHLSIVANVSQSMALTFQQISPLSSISLAVLHYEVTDSDEAHGLQKPAESYYAYLASSIHHNTLPALTTIYVRDQTFPDLLLVPPIKGSALSDEHSLRKKTDSANFYSASQARGIATVSALNQQLEIYSKGADELDWGFTSVAPSTALGLKQGVSIEDRPLSAHSALKGRSPQWAQGGFGGDARRSVIVGNGSGGFLTVPANHSIRPITPEAAGNWDSNGATRDARLPLSPPSPRYKSASSLLSIPGGTIPVSERRNSRHDLWR